MKSENFNQVEAVEDTPLEIGFFQWFVPCLMLFGYDFRDRLKNFILYTFGDIDVKIFTASRHFANFGFNGNPLTTAELRPSLATEKILPQISPKPGIPLIAQSFRVGYAILLAASSGVGKTFLAIFAALRAFQEHCVESLAIFSLEDRDGRQRPRFEEMLRGWDFTLISPQDLDRQMAMLEQDGHSRAALEANLFMNNPALSKLFGIYNQRLKEGGITPGEKRPLKLIAFLLMVDDLIKRGVRFFILDSLTKIFDNPNSISREMLETFLSVFKESGATFIVIHHLNIQGEFRGSNLITADFDEAYILEKVGPKNETYDLLRIRVEKNRSEHEDDFWIKRTRKSEYVAEHEVLLEPPAKIQERYAQKNRSVKERIKEALLSLDSPIVNREDLLKALGTESNRRTVTNNLIALESEGFLAKLNSSSWDKIKIR
jgi:hypothetical protein